MPLDTPGSLLFRIKKDNTKPAIQFQVFNPDGTPRNLTGVPVLFYMKKDAVMKVNGGVCTAVNAAIGLMEYQWAAGDTSEVGTFRAEVKLNGNETYPTETYITVHILADLP